MAEDLRLDWTPEQAGSFDQSFQQLVEEETPGPYRPYLKVTKLLDLEAYQVGYKVEFLAIEVLARYWDKEDIFYLEEVDFLRFRDRFLPDLRRQLHYGVQRFELNRPLLGIPHAMAMQLGLESDSLRVIFSRLTQRQYEKLADAAQEILAPAPAKEEGPSRFDRKDPL